MALKKILSVDDVDDTPVNGVTTEPISSNWAYDHAANLTAHSQHLGVGLITGKYFISPHCVYTSAWANKSVNKDRLHATLFYLPIGITADALAIYIGVAGVGASAMRLGIYSNGTDNRPDALVLDAGTIDATQTGLQAIVIDQDLTQGLYWLALVHGYPDTDPQVVHRVNDALQLIDTIASGASGIQTVYKTYTYGALPDPFGTPSSEQGYILRLLLKPSSVG